MHEWTSFLQTSRVKVDRGMNKCSFDREGNIALAQGSNSLLVLLFLQITKYTCEMINFIIELKIKAVQMEHCIPARARGSKFSQLLREQKIISCQLFYEQLQPAHKHNATI